MLDLNTLYVSERLEAPDAFKDLFTHFYVARNGTDQAIRKTLVPTFQTMMVFSLGSPIGLKSTVGSAIDINGAIVLGPIKQPLEYTLRPGADMLVVNFRSDGFSRFFGSAIASQSLPVFADAILGENCFANLCTVLRPLDTSKRIALVLEFSQPYIRGQDPTMKHLADVTFDESVDSVKTVAHESGQSERTIQLKHKKYLGYSAKEITRYRRFLRTIEFIERSLEQGMRIIDWQKCVEEFGYYDQSHLIHDFQFYLGLSPARYVSFQQDICLGAVF